jgi:hypothetical protein
MWAFWAERHPARMSQTEYVFDTAERVERQRLRAQTALWDPFVFRRFQCVAGFPQEAGVAEGWRRLELNGGQGPRSMLPPTLVSARGHRG